MLTEDQFFFLQFISGKKVTPSEFMGFIPPNRVWLEHEKTNMLVNLLSAGLISDRNFYQDSEGYKSEYFKLSVEGEKLLSAYIKQKQRLDEERELQFRKLKIDVENAERINATYWWTFWIAVIGFAISLFLAILKITGQSN